MPKKQTETYTITEGGEVLGDSQKVIAWLSDVFSLFAGGRVKITVERPKRSLRQNAYYWSIVLPKMHEGLRERGMTTMQFMGPSGEVIEIPLSVNTLHRWYKRKILTPDEPGEEPTTTTLDKTAMHYYIEEIRMEAAAMDIHIPQPNTPPIEAYGDST